MIFLNNISLKHHVRNWIKLIVGVVLDEMLKCIGTVDIMLHNIPQKSAYRNLVRRVRLLRWHTALRCVTHDIWDKWGNWMSNQICGWTATWIQNKQNQLSVQNVNITPHQKALASNNNLWLSLVHYNSQCWEMIEELNPKYEYRSKNQDDKVDLVILTNIPK